MVGGSSLPLGLETFYLRGEMVTFVIMLLGRRGILVSTPCDNGYVATETLSRGGNYQMWSYGSIGCLLFQKSAGPTLGRNHTETVVIDPGGPAITREADGSRRIFRSGAEGPLAKKMRTNQRPVDSGVTGASFYSHKQTNRTYIQTVRRSIYKTR